MVARDFALVDYSGLVKQLVEFLTFGLTVEINVKLHNLAFECWLLRCAESANLGQVDLIAPASIKSLYLQVTGPVKGAVDTVDVFSCTIAFRLSDKLRVH